MINILVLVVLLCLQIYLNIEFRRLGENIDRLNTYLNEITEINKLIGDAQGQTADILSHIANEIK